MTDAAVVALLAPVAWAPPGTDPAVWRAAMAEDVVDLLTPLPRIQAAIAAVAADLPLARRIAWPSTRIYEIPAATIRAALTAAANDGHDKAAVVLADAPDLPAMLIGKLLRPLSTRHLAVAPAHNGGLLAASARLPVPDWLPDLDAETGDVAAARRPAPEPTMVASAPGWHRLRTADDLQRLDLSLDGWEATRAILT
ncbi:hypothetical protein Dvina_05320 [Dactylosporangium vinaceum]|uniref:MobA-like NTP transferase domain-containing protein n=1 Tax=Dactylosporangium vinaceum TaxID=53362 RepID=A0ABV5MIE0_9ACTN|nr:hypothetical protein [Dactylosporangium vinaceum]UAB97569.1 hypothetical protein Dvina_05320 [Dactylosporangium vinaceum]